MAANVLVLGTLGDLVKKIVELEMLDRTPSRETAVQMAAYYSVLEQWPIDSKEDKEHGETLIQSFRIIIAKLIVSDLSLSQQIDEVNRMKFASDDYTRGTYLVFNTSRTCVLHRNHLKLLLKQLNSLGKHIGSPPLSMEIVDGEKFGTDAQLGSNENDNSSGS